MQSPFKTIREMIGRLTIEDQINKLSSIRFAWTKNINSEKLERTNYALTKAIYYASKITENGKTYGEDYLLGASFGRKVVHAVASFGFSQPLQVTFTDSSAKDIDTAESFIKDWLEDNGYEILKLAINTLRDGDSFIKIKDNLSAVLLDPNRISYDLDPVNGEIVAVNDTVKIQEENVVYIYKTVYTNNYPFEITYKYKAGEEKNKTIISSNSGTETAEAPVLTNDLLAANSSDVLLNQAYKPIPIVGFHNNKESGYAYGYSEYQNLYFLFANYHAVLYEAIKGNIFNSQITPYITGVDNKEEFMRNNGELQDNGEYRLKFDKGDIWVGGENFDIKMISTSTNAGEAQTILETIFWLICQASEVPEFIMGTAVQSSKASVSEQLPVMLKKAEMKRAEFLEYFKQLIQLVVDKAISIGALDVSPNIRFSIKYAPMVDEDKELNLRIIETLSGEGVISDETKLKLMNLSVIENINEELAKAKDENSQKSADYKVGINDQLRIQQELNNLNNNE